MTGPAFAGPGPMLVPVGVAACYFGISARRVREMRENDEILSPARDLIDLPHAFNARIGRMFLSGEKLAEADKFVTAGVGWIMVRCWAGISQDDLDDWKAMAGQWGLSQSEAMTALKTAARLIGPLPPRGEVATPRPPRRR
ncbi:MAG: hypothetical protein ACK46Q_03790 [Hyphomonas sp.]